MRALATALLLLLGCYQVREYVHKPLGLITVPNKYGVYGAGALSTARNVCMRDEGVLTSMPATRAYRSDVTSSGYTLRKLYAAGSSLLAIGDNAGAWQARWITASASTAITTTPAGGTTTTFDTAKTHVASARSRYFVTSLSNGVLALDSEGDTTVRSAGLRPLVFAQYQALTGQAVLSLSSASYRLVLRRIQSDGYELMSPPSHSWTYYNQFGSDQLVRLAFTIPASGGIIAGDLVDVFRTKNVSGTASPGDTYYLAYTYTITSTDITNGYILTDDNIADNALGEELYTNPGRPVPRIVGVGGSYVNDPPGFATDAWQFKGRTFYAAQKLNSFKKLHINGRFGDVTATNDRAAGIGTRTVVGDTTNGNPTLANVSAADLVGIKVGQSRANSGGTITSIGATSITFNTNFTSTVVGTTITIYDRIEVNGVNGIMGSFALFVGQADYFLGAPNTALPLERSVFYKDSNQDAYVVSDTPAFYGGLTSQDAYGVDIELVQGFYGDGTLTVRATNGANYSPPIAEIGSTATNGDSDERFNRLQWSKPDQPESVPPQQELLYGNGVHYRGIPTLDATWLFASDGLWRLSGDDDEYRVDPIDPQLVLAGRNAVAKLGERIYAYTERGLVRISDAGGVERIAEKIIQDRIPGAAYADTWDTFVAADEMHREIWLSFRSGGSTTSYVFNEVTGAFVDVVDTEWSAMEYAPYLRSLVIGAVDSTPDVKYFEADTSTTRMSGADVRFQPFTGGDAFALKEWQDVNFIFEGVGSTMSLTPRFGSTNYNARTVAASTVESRVRVAVPRNAPALAARLTPGFTFASGGTSNLWSLRGISVTAQPAGDEVKR